MDVARRSFSLNFKTIFDISCILPVLTFNFSWTGLKLSVCVCVCVCVCAVHKVVN